MDIEIIIICGNRHVQEDGSTVWNNAQHFNHIIISTTDDVNAAKKEALNVFKHLLEDIK